MGVSQKMPECCCQGSGKYFAKAEQAGGICDARYEEKDGKGLERSLGPGFS